MARKYRGIIKDENCIVERFCPSVNYSIVVLKDRLSDMIKVYETMKDNDSTDNDFRKQKLLIYSKILQMQSSITILEKHQI
jgi:hypothetical protein